MKPSGLNGRRVVVGDDAEKEEGATKAEVP